MNITREMIMYIVRNNIPSQRRQNKSSWEALCKGVSLLYKIIEVFFCKEKQKRSGEKRKRIQLIFLTCRVCFDLLPFPASKAGSQWTLYIFQMFYFFKGWGRREIKQWTYLTWSDACTQAWMPSIPTRHYIMMVRIEFIWHVWFVVCSVCM